MLGGPCPGTPRPAQHRESFMATIDKATVTWTGYVGAPGYSNFFATPDGNVATRIHAFFTSLKPYLPSSVVITVPNGGDSLDSATGAVTGTWAITPAPALITGGSTSEYAGGAGLSVTWYTDGIVGGKHVRGRTYICPLNSASYENNGTLGSACLTAARNAANLLVVDSAEHLMVWHRPVSGVGGSAHKVMRAQINDRVAYMHSRAV